MVTIKAIESWAVNKPRLRVNGMLRYKAEWHPLNEVCRDSKLGDTIAGVVERIIADRQAADYRLPAGDWTFRYGLAPSDTDVYWKAHQHYFASHGAREPETRDPVWVGEMRVPDLMYGVMNDIARTQGYRNFDHYHQWFMENVLSQHPGRGVPSGSTEVWPVILSTFADEGLQDGNHRFHQYVEMGLETIPVLAYATEFQTIKLLAQEWLWQGS